MDRHLPLLKCNDFVIYIYKYNGYIYILWLYKLVTSKYFVIPVDCN